MLFVIAPSSTNLLHSSLALCLIEERQELRAKFGRLSLATPTPISEVSPKLNTTFALRLAIRKDTQTSQEYDEYGGG